MKHNDERKRHLYDSSTGEYVIKIADSNEREILIDNPRFKKIKNPSNFINTTNNVKQVLYQ